MILLDEILEVDDIRLVAALTVPERGLFNDSAYDGAVPAWVGIEYMAQSVAAHAGYRSRVVGEMPKIGFLLGARLYQSNVSCFPCGTRLIISVEELMQAENGMAVYAASIEADGILVQSRINGFQPSDSESFLRGDK
jgi:predicted hotdog family 3-hydroxylacyl-ACP dehydratase